MFQKHKPFNISIAFKSRLKGVFRRHLTFALGLTLIACTPQADKNTDNKQDITRQSPTIQHSPSQELDRRKAYKIMQRDGVSVLHQPPKIAPEETTFKLNSTTCLDADKLPNPWYVTSASFGRVPNAFKYKPFPPEGSIVLAIKSSDLGIPFYNVYSPRPVDYEFVTFGQEYLTVMVAPIAVFKRQMGVLEQHDFFENHLIPNYYLPYKAHELLQQDEWDFKIYGSQKCPGCDPEAPYYIVDFKRQAHAKVRLAVHHWFEDNVQARFLPTQGVGPFFVRYLEGLYVDTSHHFGVSFRSTSRATLHTPLIFNEIDKAVTAMMVECEE
ncbi:MAG: hypothetical protein ABJ275_08580 [Maricaulaceae bacterium]